MRGKESSTGFRVAAAVLGALVLCGGTADAFTKRHHHGDDEDYPSTDRVRIELRGRIAPRCGFDNLPNRMELPQALDGETGGAQAGRATIEFDVTCNSAFRYQVKSEGGGLRQHAGGAPPAPFRSRIEYALTLDTPTVHGRTRGDCQSVEMVGAPCVVRSERTVEGPARLTVSWPGDPRPLVAGRYEDRVRIKIIPNVGGY